MRPHRRLFGPTVSAAVALLMVVSVAQTLGSPTGHGTPTGPVGHPSEIGAPSLLRAASIGSQGPGVPASTPTLNATEGQLAGPSEGPHPGSLMVYEPGNSPNSVDPAVSYTTGGLEPIQNIYQTLVNYNGSATDSFVPTLSTCVPGTPQCTSDYHHTLVVNGTGPFSGEPEYWTFVLDPSARFYDPGTGGSWGVYPSDVMFSVARTLAWANPYQYTSGWILGQALLPVGNETWDHGLHYPLNNTPANVLGSMLVNDSRYCPTTSPGVFVGHGCITFVVDGKGSAWPTFLDFVADPLGASIVPCGWFTAQSAGVPDWSGSSASHGDGSCRLPDGGTTTNSTSWRDFLGNLSATSWDPFEILIATSYPGVQPGVQWSTAGSGPYAEVSVTQGVGYALRANPAYAAPSGCTGENGLAPYSGSCEPAPGTYIGNVSTNWTPNYNTSLLAALNGTADFSEPAVNDTASWVVLQNSGKVVIDEIPGDDLFEVNFNLNWDQSSYINLSLPGCPCIPGDFFSAPAMRGLFAEAYPYAAIENSVWTVDGIQYLFPSAGPIPKDMAPYSSSIYPPSGNVSFPNGTPDYNPDDTGGAEWWWAQAMNGSSPWFDPELEACEDGPCSVPIISISGDAQMYAAMSQYVASLEAISSDMLFPFIVNVSIGALYSELAGSGTNPFPVYPVGWAPDFPDPTDYLAPYAEPDGAYTGPDAVNETLSLPQYNNLTCGNANASLAALAYYSHVRELPPECQGVAYEVAVGMMSVAASLAPGPARTLDYNLITQVLSDLDLYAWQGQANQVVAVAPWINESSLNTNPVAGGVGAQFWFQLRYVSAVSPSTPEKISVGTEPGTPMYDPENGEIYVPNSGSSSVSVLSGSTQQLLYNVSVGADPQTPVLDPGNGEVFVANYGSGNVTVINGASGGVVANVTVGTGPWEPTYDPVSGGLFVANNGSDTVSVVLGADNAVIATLPVGVEPGTPAYDSANGELYVPNYGSANVSVLNGTTDALVTTVSVGSGPVPPVYDPSNGDIYVPNYDAGTISVIWGSTNTVVATLLVGTLPFVPAQTPTHMFSRTTVPRGTPLYDPSNGEIYVSNSASGNVSVISGVKNQIVATVAVGTSPDAPIYDPSDGNIYVANNGSANISVVSGATNVVVDTLPTAANPAPPVVDGATGTLYVPDSGSASVNTVPSSFYITIQETGLPAGASWHVALAAKPGSTGSLFSRTTVPFAEGNGTYSYTIVGPSGYRVGSGLAAVGHLTVSGADLPETVHFVVGKTYSATFRESGLAKGSSWCVTVGWEQCTTTAALTVKNLTPSHYPFAVVPIAGFRVSFGPGGTVYTGPPNASVNVTSHGVTVKVKFVPVTYALTFEETGLPSGKSWSVRIEYVSDGRATTKHKGSRTPTIVFEVPNGTFTYTVAHVSGYTGNVTATVSVAGSPISASVTFTKVPPRSGPPSIPSASESLTFPPRMASRPS